MKRIYILCEGQTEEKFINDMLSPFFVEKEKIVIPIIISTKRTPFGKIKGGVSTFGKIKKELSLLCGQHNHEYVTMMFDYYRLPDDTPEYNNTEADIYKKIAKIENAIKENLQFENLICYLSLHEFESLLFSDTSCFKTITENNECIRLLEEIKKEYDNPELINNGIETAPSKRILSVLPDYSKILHGNRVAEKIGLQKMRRECKHFNEWIQKLLEL